MDCPSHLIYVSDCMPGLCRRRRGKGFVYLDESGQRIQDPETLERIKNLVIPPMWESVWICNRAEGHLQATGMDQKRRKQYLYHADWIAFRQESKFARMLEFGHTLPTIRSQVRSHLRISGWPKEKVLALVVKLLDELHIRVGNECYREANETFGLTTLRRKHLKLGENQLSLEFKGKSGVYRKVTIKNKSLIKLIRGTSQLPGYELFRYLEDGVSKAIDSRDVNDYIQTISGASFSAKDFRTWGGTVLALEKYPEALREVEENPRRKFDTALVRAVANELGNTLAVCREYYIHPQVLEVLVNHELAPYLADESDDSPRDNFLKPLERAVLNILEGRKQTSSHGTEQPKKAAPTADLMAVS